MSQHRFSTIVLTVCDRTQIRSQRNEGYLVRSATPKPKVTCSDVLQLAYLENSWLSIKDQTRSTREDRRTKR